MYIYKKWVKKEMYYLITSNKIIQILQNLFADSKKSCHISLKLNNHIILPYQIININKENCHYFTNMNNYQPINLKF